jgi:AcrR family transcriptional regulator
MRRVRRTTIAVFREGTMHRVEKRAKTRARLIEAALNVFAFGGYEHATVDDIAHAAHLSKGAFYFNFNSTEEILVELLRQWSDERTSLLNAAFAFEDADGRLRALAEALSSYRAGTNWPPLILEFWSQALRSGEFDRWLRRAYRDWRELLATAAREAGKANPGPMADAILAIHDGAVTEIALGRTSASTRSAPALAAMVVGAAPASTEPFLQAAGA